MNKKGFTLVEILVVVMIVAILVTIAVPMYEKTIEKSRITEVRTILSKLFDSKQRIMNSMDQNTYGNFGFENLDFALACQKRLLGTDSHVQICGTKDFDYVLWPDSNNPDYVCAVRNQGDQLGVSFLYKGNMNGISVPLLCYDGVVKDGCAVYGLDSTGSESFCTTIKESL